MFSYLHGMRPNSRRSAIHPTTVPQQAITSRFIHDKPPTLSDPPLLPQPDRPPDAGNPSPVSSTPPILPPIPRVASRHESDRPDVERLQRSYTEEMEGQGLEQADQPSVVTMEPKGTRFHGLSVQDRYHGIRRNETMPASMDSREIGTQARELRATKPTKAHATFPTQVQTLPTKPTQKTAEIPLPLPQLDRKPSKTPPPMKPPLHVKSQTNPPKQGKAKLNLLNPMSLLARRRSSQAVVEASRDKHFRSEDTNVPPLRLPDNYDPCIRGKVVHDFDSAPRSARSGNPEAGTPPKSSNGQDPYSGGQHTIPGAANDEESPSSTEKEHTPMFKEHFDEGMEVWQEGREGLDKRPKSGFMYKVALQEPGPHPDPLSLPAFARNLPTSFSTSTEPVQRVASPPRAPLEVVLEAALSESLPKNPSIISSPPTSPPSKPRSRASSNTDISYTTAGVPIRYKSNASRFSFDLAGVGSTAQEQLLEEKHRQKEKEKARASSESAKTTIDRDEDDEDQEPDFDDMLDDDGFEERIPGVNADVDDDMPVSQHVSANIGVLDVAAPSKSTSIKTMSPVSESVSSPDSLQHHESRGDDFQHPAPLSTFNNGDDALRLNHSLNNNLQIRAKPSHDHVDRPMQSEIHRTVKPLEATLPQRPMEDDQEEDDMYFDDGMIEDMDDENGPVFDESLFDDETSNIYGIPIRDLPKPQQPPPRQEPISDIETTSPDSPINLRRSSVDDAVAEELRDSLPDLSQTTRPVFSNTAGLTQDNLAAYHNALAFAANQAALNGKFVRQHSIQSQQAYNPEWTDGKPPGLVPVGESPSLEINGLPLSRTLPTSEEYDFDDALSDDPIIAEANAEALENDDEDFYGQEFGFYARATGTGEYANGGYFGQGIMRSHSGRNVEPALTPITERSEWSNRNSAIGLAMQGYSQVSLPQPSPGLAQLADMMHHEEDNMSLSALMKLRRGAWGSSTTSLQSSSGTSNGSPLTYLPPMPSNAAALQYQQQQQQQQQQALFMQQGVGNSTYSLNSSNGDSSGSDNSHTITLNKLQGITIPPGAHFMQPSYSTSGSESSPVQSRPRSGLMPAVKGKGHSRHGSGGGDRESVSYVHERDADGDRWVLEKRRVGEDGAIEVLGREVVEGGRI